MIREYFFRGVLIDDYTDLNPGKHSSWWRRLEDVFRPHFQKTSSRRLQDVLMKTNIFLLIISLQKTSSRRLGQDQYIRLVHTSSRRFPDVLKTSPKYVWKISSRRFEDVSSSWTVFVNKTLRSIQHVCKTYCKDRCLEKDSPRSHFWEVYGKYTKFARVIKISQDLVFQFTTPKYAGTSFSQNTTGRLLLVLAVSIVVKGELAN